MTDRQPPIYMTPVQIAELTGLTHNRVKELSRNRSCPRLPKSHRVYIHAARFVAWLEAGTPDSEGERQ